MPLINSMIETVTREFHCPLCSTKDLLHRAFSEWTAGNVTSAIRWGDRAVQLSCPAGSGCLRAETAVLWLVSVFVGLRECGPADALIEDAYRRLDEDRDGDLRNSLKLARAYSRYYGGRPQEAVALAKEGLAALEECPESHWLSFGRLVMAAVTFRQGDLRGAIRCEEALREDMLMGHLPWAYGQTLWVYLQLAEAKDGAARAAMLVRQLSTSSAALTELLMSEPAAAAWLVRLALKRGHREAAETVATAAHELAERAPEFPSLRAAARHARGLLHTDTADLSHAAKHHHDGWARASALEDLAVLHTARGQSGPSVAGHLERALEAYGAVESARDYARVKQRLRGAGRIPQTPRCGEGENDVQQPTDALGLTEGEHKVATLVAQGFTNTQVANQLFLSKHTVAFHLRKIFKKLDLESRAELMRMWSLRTAA